MSIPSTWKPFKNTDGVLKASSGKTVHLMMRAIWLVSMNAWREIRSRRDRKSQIIAGARLTSGRKSNWSREWLSFCHLRFKVGKIVTSRYKWTAMTFLYLRVSWKPFNTALTKTLVCPVFCLEKYNQRTRHVGRWYILIPSTIIPIWAAKFKISYR